MITEDYCSYELSKLLKDKGFDVMCICYYRVKHDPLFGYLCGYNLENHNGNKDEISAPTHQMACGWLREKGLHIEIYTNASGYRFIVSKTPPNGTDLVTYIKGDNDGGAWDNYDDCVEDAIKYTLENLL